jgi:hypothetical protein
MGKHGFVVVLALLVASVAAAQFGRSLPPPELAKLGEQLGLEVAFRGGPPKAGDEVKGHVADPAKLARAGVGGAVKGDAVVLTFAGGKDWDLTLVKSKAKVKLHFQEGKWKVKPESKKAR